LQKLALYATGRSITEQDIRTLVPQVSEANIYAAVDALVEGRTAPGVQAIQRLRADGTGFSEIAARLGEQLRRVMLAKEVLANGGKEADVREKLNIQYDFIVRRVVQQAQRTPQSRLEYLYASLLDADLAIKRGRLDEDLALDLLLSRFSVDAGQRRG
jgi:DNA polymerase-3 subunit delta